MRQRKYLLILNGSLNAAIDGIRHLRGAEEQCENSSFSHFSYLVIVHTHTHTYAHTYTHTHTHIYIYIHTYTRTYTHTHTHTNFFLFLSLYICTWMSSYHILDSGASALAGADAGDKVLVFDINIMSGRKYVLHHTVQDR